MHEEDISLWRYHSFSTTVQAPSIGLQQLTTKNTTITYIPLYLGPFNYLNLPKSDYYNQIALIISFYYRWETSFMFTQIKISVLVRLRIIG